MMESLSTQEGIDLLSQNERAEMYNDLELIVSPDLEFARKAISSPGPEEDARLSSTITAEDKEAQLKAKHHRPLGPVRSVASGSNCSWAFKYRDYMAQRWKELGTAIADITQKAKREVIAALQDLPDDSLDKEHIQQQHAESLRERIRAERTKIFDRLSNNINKVLPVLQHVLNPEMQSLPIEKLQDHMFGAGSGGKGLNFLCELFAWDETKAATGATLEDCFSTSKGTVISKETGSEIAEVAKQEKEQQNFWGQKVQYTEVEVRNTATCESRPQGDIAQDHINRIKAGDKEIILSAMPKTGIDFLVTSGMVQQVLDFALAYNVSHPEEPKVRIFLDLVQQMGRKELAQIFAFISDPKYQDVITSYTVTCSKALEAVAHASLNGLLPPAERELEILLETYKDNPQFIDWLQYLVDKHQVSYSPLLAKYGVTFDNNTLSAFRLDDGMDAFYQYHAPDGAYQAEHHQLYGERGLAVADQYVKMFEVLGARLLDSGTNSIIPFSLQYISVIRLEKTFQQHLAEYGDGGKGIGMGGIIQVGNDGVMRYAPSVTNLEDDLPTQEKVENIHRELFGDLTDEQIDEVRRMSDLKDKIHTILSFEMVVQHCGLLLDFAKAAQAGIDATMADDARRATKH